jgi:hypothetical protein
MGDCFMKAKCFLITLLILSVMFLGGCTSTSLTRVWKDATFNEKTIDSIMVLGVAKDYDVSQRFEDLFVDAFQKKNVTADAAYRLIPGSEQLTKDNVKDHKDIIKSTAEKKQLETVLITHLIGVAEVEEEVDAPKLDVHPYDSYGSMGAYHTFAYESARGPSRSVTRKYVRLRTNLFDTASEKLIWSASSESVDPDSVDTIIHELIDAVVNRLVKDGLIGSE